MKENIAMNYNTLQPLLGIDKSTPFFEVFFSPAVPDELLVHFGMRLLKTVPRNSFQRKLLIARLFNAGYNLSELSRTFIHVRKTIRNWGGLLKSGKIEDGQGSVKKITDDRLQYIRYLFDEHHEKMGCHITTCIVNEYSKIYSDKICNETIRKIIVNRKKKLHKNENYNFKNKETNNIFTEKSEYPLILYSAERRSAKNINNLFSRIYTFVDLVLPCSEDNSWKKELHTALKIGSSSEFVGNLTKDYRLSVKL